MLIRLLSILWIACLFPSPGVSRCVPMSYIRDFYTVCTVTFSWFCALKTSFLEPWLIFVPTRCQGWPCHFQSFSIWINNTKYWKQGILLIFNPHPYHPPGQERCSSVSGHSLVQHTSYLLLATTYPGQKKKRKIFKLLFPLPPFHPSATKPEREG